MEISGEIEELTEEFVEMPNSELNLDGDAMKEWMAAREIDPDELGGFLRSLVKAGAPHIGRGGMLAIAAGAMRLGFELARRRYLRDGDVPFDATDPEE